MTQVYATVSYHVFEEYKFFDQLYSFIGHFQIEQTVEESWRKCFKIWFWTNKIEIKEGEKREVIITAKRNKENLLYFELSK